MWDEILNHSLKFIEQLSGWVDFLFTDYALHIDPPDNDFFAWLVGWFVDWVNGWGVVFKPIEMIGLQTFLIFFIVFLFKMIL